jgi:hypothetical protein
MSNEIFLKGKVEVSPLYPSDEACRGKFDNESIQSVIVDISVSNSCSLDDPDFEFRYEITMTAASLVDPVCEAIKDFEGSIQLLKLM